MRHLMCAVLAALFMLAGTASAWQWETHSTLAEKVCRDFDCGCISEIRDAAVVPDRDFRDNTRHHCYNLSAVCSPSEYYSCPKKSGCPAIEQAEKWLGEAAKKQGCEKWRDIGIASHYFFDSKVFWHKVQGEDYYKCHEPFEGKAEKNFEKADGSNWTIVQCGISENYADMEAYAGEFESMVSASEGIARLRDTPLLPECGILCRIWAAFASLF